MIVREMKFHVEKHPAYMGYGIHFFSVDNGGIRAIAKNILIEESPDFSVYTEPFLKISEEQAVQLFNQLWDHGIRPNKYDEDRGALNQAKEHICDLKRILFHQLGIE